MRILLLSAYDANSHAYWRKGLVNYLTGLVAEVDVTELVLPPRHFNWRIRGNSLSWAITDRASLEQPYDVLIATSMVDLATLKGLVPALAKTPSLLYFHENQFAYPLSSQAGQKRNLEPLMVQLYSSLAADELVFNSAYNLSSFLQGVESLLSQFPDHVPQGVRPLLEAKASVLHVPLQKPNDIRGEKQPNSVVWNHRWEYDKGPAGLLACIERLDSNLDCKFHIVGQSFRRVPPEFDTIKSILEARGWLGDWGFQASEADYYKILSESQVALSTAIHDFQGLSVLEAVARGCVPVVPNRLAYPELFPAENCYAEDPNVAEEGLHAARLLSTMWRSPPDAPLMSHLYWAELGPLYYERLKTLCGRDGV